jgi:hypothetical protein
VANQIRLGPNNTGQSECRPGCTDSIPCDGSEKPDVLDLARAKECETRAFKIGCGRAAIELNHDRVIEESNAAESFIGWPDASDPALGLDQVKNASALVRRLAIELDSIPPFDQGL